MSDKESLNHEVSPDNCFLCGIALTSETKSKEHVFPVWLMDEFDLRRRQITLLNGTFINYENLVIPCCVACNTGPLSRLENTISTALREGTEAVRKLDPEILFLWLAKFYFGLIVREMTLVQDRSSGTVEYIVTPEVIQLFSIHQLLLSRLNGKVEWDTFPGSIFIFECLEDLDVKKNFDYFDSIHQPFVSIRIGKTYVAAFLQDFGAVKEIGVDSWDPLRRAAECRLNAEQTIELDCFFLGILKAHKVAKLLIHQDEGRSIIQVLPRGGLSGRPPFNEWMSADECFELMQNMFQKRIQMQLERSETGFPTFFPTD